MTNDEIRMTKEFASPKHPAAGWCQSRLRPGASSFIRHSTFGIRHSTAPLIAVLFLGVAGREPAAASPEAPERLAELEFQLPSGTEKTSEHALHLRGKDARQQLLVTAKLDRKSVV